MANTYAFGSRIFMFTIPIVEVKTVVINVCRSRSEDVLVMERTASSILTADASLLGTGKRDGELCKGLLVHVRSGPKASYSPQVHTASCSVPGEGMSDFSEMTSPGRKSTPGEILLVLDCPLGGSAHGGCAKYTCVIHAANHTHSGPNRV